MGGARHIFFAGRRSHAGGQPPRGVVPVYGPSAEPEVVTPSAAAAAAAAADRGRLLSKAATSRAVVVAAAAETATAVEGDSRASRRAAAAALPLPARLPFLSGAAPLASRVAQ